MATETLSNTASTATPASSYLLVQRNAELLVGLQQLGIDLVQALELQRRVLGRRVVIGVLIVDRADSARAPSSARSSCSQRSKAPSRHSSIHSGSSFLAEMKRTVSSDRPFGARSISMSVTKPYLYFSPAGGDRYLGCLFCHCCPHAAARGCARFRTRAHASATAFNSSAVVDQPKLTRMRIAPAPARRPSRVSTWLRRTLPDEQAAPALTATPSRSSAITAVSALMPGTATQMVLASRGASCAEDHGVGQSRVKLPLRNRSRSVCASPSDRDRAAPLRQRRRSRRSRRRFRCRRAARAPGRRRQSAARAARRRARRARRRLAARRSCAREGGVIEAELGEGERRSCRPPAPRRSEQARRRPCASAATSASGWITPVSLFAAITATSARPLPSRSNAAEFRKIDHAIRRHRCISMTARPAWSLSQSAALASTESCSIAETNRRVMRSPPPQRP